MNAASPPSPAPAADERSERPAGGEVPASPADGGVSGSPAGSSADDSADDSVDTSSDEVDEESSDQSEEPAFGAAKPTRFGADVEYRGRADSHDYLARVRHRLLDTSFTVVIDGVEHDPVAEEKARKAATKSERTAEESTEGDSAEESGADADEPDADGPNADEPDASGPDADQPDADQADDDEVDADEVHAAATDGPRSGRSDDDGLRFRVEDGFTTLHCTVRRLDEDGEREDAEVLTLRTAGLGGAGEAEVRHGFRTTVLVPAEGSPSAAREAKRIAHPTRYALIAAVTKSAKFLLPLLGFGALFSGLLDPVKEWVEARISPAVDAVSRMVAPVLDWIDEVTRPVREFLEALFSPARDFLAAILRPVRDFLRWLLSLLPDISLPFDIPEWVVDIAVPVLIVLVVFFGTLAGIKHRREKLAETRSRGGGAEAQGRVKSPRSTYATGQERREDDEDDTAGRTEAPPAP